MADTQVPGSKPWYKSLTIQGAIVVAVAGAITTSGPNIIEAFGVGAPAAIEVCKTAAQLLTDAGAAMAMIGRLRLGDLT